MEHVLRIGDVDCALQLGAGVDPESFAAIGVSSVRRGTSPRPTGEGPQATIPGPTGDARSEERRAIVARVERVASHDDVEPMRQSTASFFHGSVRARSRADGTLELDDGEARVTVAPGGASVSARVTDAALGPTGVFVRTTLVVAIVLGLRWQQRFHIHAGLCRTADGRLVLLAGTSGAGKSTSTAMLGEAGLEMLSDDACFLSEQATGVCAAPFAKPFHLNESALVHAHALAAHGWHLIAPGRFEADFMPAPHAPARIDAVLLIAPERAPQTLITPASAADTVAGLLESSALIAADGLPHRELHFALLGTLAGQARALHLVPGRDFLDAPRAVWARIDAALRERA